jgi:peptidoglycan/xylan/chitin deacetylase (PgdA/CDA1 family)
MFYLVKTPWWLKRLYPGLLWQMPVASGEKVIYLTFDDGPHPEATPFALDELKKYNARATFFCIGKNVQEYPQLYRRLLMEGHRVGNHTQNHLNGWKADDKKYLENIREASHLIDSDLFRPPYGRITRFQAALLKRDISAAGAVGIDDGMGMKVVMWEVLSGDFDQGIDAGQCLKNVIRNTRSGSIVVFHDSGKALNRMSGALPEVLKHFSGLGYKFEAIS